MRLFGSCWGVSSQNRALLEAHYGPASTEADANDFGEWAEPDDEKDDEPVPNGNNSAPSTNTNIPKASQSSSGGLSLSSKAPVPAESPSAAPPPTIARPAAPAQARGGAKAPAAPQQVDEGAASSEDFFADMAPTVTRNPVVPPARTGPSRLALTVRVPIFFIWIVMCAKQDQSSGGAWDEA
jgi:hypothetical protein